MARTLKIMLSHLQKDRSELLIHFFYHATTTFIFKSIKVAV